MRDYSKLDKVIDFMFHYGIGFIAFLILIGLVGVAINHLMR